MPRLHRLAWRQPPHRWARSRERPALNLQARATQPAGLFVSFEGTEGVGKTTLIEHVRRALGESGQPVLRTREPGGTPLAERLREQLLCAGDEPVAPDCELLLMFAARSQHLHQRILPALEAGHLVLCDRFVDSSYAYQCNGRGVARSKVDALVAAFVPRLPDLTFWLDAPLAVAMQRMQARSLQLGQVPDRFEQEKSDFFERVRAGFAAQAQQHPTRIVRLDATCSPDALARQALHSVQQKIQALPAHTSEHHPC